MKVQDLPVIDFINSTNRTFIIPVYQRNYSWNTKNCKKLFDDALDAYRNGKEHYFGNVVYYSIDVDVASAYFRLALIDGQQRITSVMLLIAAMRDAERDRSVRENIDSNYLLNRTGYDSERIKLKQVQSDRKIYEDIIKGAETANPNKGSNVYKNYSEFSRLVRQSGLTTNELLRMLRMLKIVAVDLELSNNPSAESPQLIFESINATGQPLSVVDLLRNYLLLGVGESEQERFYNDFWTPIEQNTSSVDDSRCSTQDFLNKYIEMRLADSVKKGSEYEVFKKNIADMFDDSGEAMQDMRKFSGYYQAIKCPEKCADRLSVKCVSALKDLNELRADNTTSLLMWILNVISTSSESYDDGVSDFTNVVRILEAWLFRVRISGLISTGAIGRIPLGVLRYFQHNRSKQLFANELVYALSNYETGDVWPNDETFENAFIQYDFYNNYKNYVMRKLEYCMSNDRINVKPDTIEHVLPQALTDYWKSILGDGYAELQARYLNTIGNLAPLNKGENSAAQNDEFDKKKKYYKNSSWMLTRQIADYESWGVDSIKNRAMQLSEVAAKVWRGPGPREIAVRALIRTAVNSRDISKINDGLVFARVINSPSCYANARAVVGHDRNGRKIITLMRGSIINRNVRPDVGWVVKQRQELSECIRDDGDKIIVIKDISFDLSKPSRLSNFVLGRSDNGWTTWLDKDGHSLDYHARLK